LYYFIKVFDLESQNLRLFLGTIIDQVTPKKICIGNQGLFFCQQSHFDSPGPTPFAWISGVLALSFILSFISSYDMLLATWGREKGGKGGGILST
jgi:hypothetical protein